MPVPRLSKVMGERVRDIAGGRRLYADDCILTLRYGYGGGDGLRLTAEVEGQALTLWLASAQWCRWIRPVLEVPDWPSLAPDLHPALASWTLGSLEESLSTCGFAWPQGITLSPSTVARAPYVCLEIEQNDRQIHAWVLEAPDHWLGDLSAALEPIEPPQTLGEQPVAVDLIAGWGRIEQQTLARLRPGDALLLCRRYPIAEGILGVFLHRPLATVAANERGTYTLETVMQDFDDWLDAAPDASTSDSPLCPDLWVGVVAQVATIDIPLHQLACLQAGDILQGAARLEEGVQLKVAGRTIAHGLLLDIEGRLAVRIERLA